MYAKPAQWDIHQIYRTLPKKRRSLALELAPDANKANWKISGQYNRSSMSPRRKSPLKLEVTQSHMCSVDLRLKILGQLPFFKGLSQDALEKINQSFHEVGYEVDEIICFAGDPVERLFVVADGRVKLVRHALTGKDVLLDMLTVGEFFGSLANLDNDVYPDTAQAQTPVCVLTIGRDAFRHILDRYPSVTLKVVDIMAARLRAAHERVRQLSVSPVEARIAHVLLVLSGKFGQQSEVGMLIQVPLAREDLASMAGTTPETASRVMSQFQKEGLVEAGRQWVAVLERDRLEMICDSK
jgi:CRP/FNR family transcriptional regulator, nitrogen oxide reductase regulator